MSVTWCNVYRRHLIDYPCLALQESDPKECQYWASKPCNAESWVAVVELWNGNQLRPCVGMRADQASHVWFVGPTGRHECLYDRLTNRIALESAWRPSFEQEERKS